MRMRDTKTLNPLKSLLSAYQSSVKQLQLKNPKPDEAHLVSDLVLAPVIHGEIAKREESIAQFKDNRRLDLAETEVYEVQVLQQYLVQPQTTPEYVRRVTMEAIESMRKIGAGSNDPASMSPKRIFSFLDLDKKRKEALGPILCDQKMKRRVISEVIRDASDRVDKLAESELDLVNKRKEEDTLTVYP
jgi:uncharacterized protein YqeY